MSRSVVYLNLLGDNQEQEEQAVTKLREGLSVRYKRNKFKKFFGNKYVIKPHHIFALLSESKLGNLTTANHGIDPESILTIKEDCRTAWKIFISAHGHMNCTDYIYGGQFYGTEPLASLQQMCDLLIYLLPGREKKYQLELMICYAARTLTYLEGQQADVAAEFLRTSLAYKLCKKLNEERLVRVTARTGATGFDEFQQCITVEKDEHAELESERRSVLETAEYKAADAWMKQQGSDFKRLMAQKFDKTEYPRVPQVQAVAAANENEERAKTFYLARCRYHDIREEQREQTDAKQYGTIRFHPTGNGVKITNIYTGETLYEGAWM